MPAFAASSTDTATATVAPTIGLLPKLIDWAGGGASVPLTGFGNLLAQGVRDAIQEDGFLGVFTGGLQAAAGGLSAALGFGLLAAICFHPKDK